MRLGFFGYPWDLADEGPETAVGTMAGRCRCNALALNVTYHHARLLRPRAHGPKTVTLPGAVAAFQPIADRYPYESLVPLAHAPLVESRVVARTREACARQGLDFGAWAVMLHNSTLGERNPNLCTVNCFGDRYTYSLCPSWEAVQDYLAALVADLCLQFEPERVIAEAVGYLGLRHGVHHELFFPRWDEALEMLSSLCFCPACLRRAQAAGLDPVSIRNQVAEWAERLLQRESGGLSPAFVQGELTSLLAEVPGLNEYLAIRSRAVAGGVCRLAATAAERGAELDLIPASFHRPVSRAWLEGARLGELAAVCDYLVIPAYVEHADEVAADLQWAGWLAPQAKLVAGLNACEAALAGPAALAAQVQACRAAGCQGIYVYNYGLLSEARLDWIAQANAEVQKI